MITLTYSIYKNNWRLSFGNTPYRFKSAPMAYSFLEKKLSRYLASCRNKKTSIKVRYDQQDHYNESIVSSDEKYLLRICASFLEDHVSKDWLVRRESQYDNG